MRGKFCYALMTLCLFPYLAQAQVQTKYQNRPNIVMIMVDDSALMDFGIYGGEAETPNIDALARRGAMFTQYRTSPLCSPTRAMFLTGIDNHRTGMATIPEVLPPGQKGKRGYSMSLEPTVKTIGNHLRANGYRTLMTGKWHLGETAQDMPNNHGFDRSFALAASGADNWEDKSYIPYYESKAPWFEDGVPVSLPEDFYSSQFIVDRMITYLQATDEAKPFLAYLPFQAIHIPVQAPPEFTAKYKGRFDGGWDELQQARHERAQALGLIPHGVPLAPMPEDVRRWDEVDEETRKVYAARMEVNAGMLTAMDYHIGRFVDYLKENDQFENTIFVITSDNGPEPSRGDHTRSLSIWMKLNGYNIELENIGEKGSWGFIGTEWALANSSPGTLYKFYATEGGVRVPLIIAGPGIEPMQINSPAMVADVTPTLLDMTQASTDFIGFQPMTGRSLLPLLKGDAETVYGPNDIRAIEVSGNTALYKGDYKILRSIPPIGDGKWRLYHLTRDPGETEDLSARKPEIFDAMLQDYANYSAEMGVLDMPEGYSSTQQIQQNITKRLRARYGKYILFIALLVLIGFWALIRKIPRRRRQLRQIW